MIVIPAVDIKGGRCAQLVQGKPQSAKYYGDPLEAAKKWEAMGAKALHLIDLDAALGSGNNFDTVREIAAGVGIPIQFGGGIRSTGYARRALGAGIERIILGSAAVREPGIVKSLAGEFGRDRIMVALDSRRGRVLVNGWTKDSGLETMSLINELTDYCFAFLVTDVDREGLMRGIDLEEFGRLSESGARICASGGISTEEDILALERLGIWGCVVGKALYEGKISIRS